MTLDVLESMLLVVRSLEKYQDLDDILEKVTTGAGKYSELDQSLRDAFATGRQKYIKYAKKLKSNALLYASHILDPRCRASMIKDMMPGKASEAIQQATEYFYAEWPNLAKDDTPVLITTLSNESIERPFGISLT